MAGDIDRRRRRFVGAAATTADAGHGAEPRRQADRYRYHARDRHLVMDWWNEELPCDSMSSSTNSRRAPLTASHGIAVDEQGNGTIAEPRLHQPIRRPEPIADRRPVIEIPGPGVEVDAFTLD